MKNKTQKIVYGLFVLGICVLFSAAMSFATWGCQPTPTEENGSTEGKVDDAFWRTTTVNGCLYVVPYIGNDAITHAGNCPNHDTTDKDLQK